jgi:putative addiction module component (TIGR02574 family)
MSTSLETVEAQAFQLSLEERAKLADRLIASLFDDQQIEDEWAGEVERRIEEIECGRAQLIPAATAIARARAAIDDPLR